MKTKSKRQKKIKAGRITHVSVSRLYNTGNYTNVKYDLSAEVPKGASVKATVLGLAIVLDGLKPIKRPSDFEYAKEIVGKDPSLLAEFQRERLDEYREKIAAHEGLKALRKQALEHLDDLGGAIENRDAKDKWEESDDAAF